MNRWVGLSVTRLEEKGAHGGGYQGGEGREWVGMDGNGFRAERTKKHAKNRIRAEFWPSGFKQSSRCDF